MPNELHSTSLLFGVFAFLDATLPLESQEGAGIGCPNGEDKGSWFRKGCPLARTINENFRLGYPGCPLREELAAFRLFHRDDMAEALAQAYRLHRRGQNPAEALSADYCLKPHGLLRWVDIAEFRATENADSPGAMWPHFQRYFRPGDKPVNYRLPSGDGYILMRGDRRVWDVETLHLCVIGDSPEWRSDYEQFLSLGGNRAFLAGGFDWPPKG